MKFLFKIFFLIFSIVDCFSQTTVYLKPTACLPIGFNGIYDTQFKNYNGSDYFGAYSLYANNGFNNNRGLINFNLSILPSNIEIIKAEISLFSKSPFSYLAGQTGENESYLKIINQNWNQNKVSWNNQPTTYNGDSVKLSKSTIYNQDYINIDVTNLIQYGIENMDLFHGFLLKLNNEYPVRAMVFYSDKYVDSTKHPYLKLTFSSKKSLYISGIVHKNEDKLKNGNLDLFNISLNKKYSTQTNENGIFNFENLEQGIYVLKARATKEFNSTFYPNTEDSLNTSTLTLGESIEDIDLYIKNTELEYGEINVSNNLTNDLLKIETNGKEKFEGNIRIFNTHGKLVKEEKVENGNLVTIDNQDLANGVYFLHIDTNLKTRFLKFVK